MEIQTTKRQAAGGRNGQGKPEEPGKLELKHQFIEYRAKGHSLRKAAKKLDICKSTAANWQAVLEKEIASAKAIELAPPRPPGS